MDGGDIVALIIIISILGGILGITIYNPRRVSECKNIQALPRDLPTQPQMQMQPRTLSRHAMTGLRLSSRSTRGMTRPDSPQATTTPRDSPRSATLGGWEEGVSSNDIETSVHKAKLTECAQQGMCDFKRRSTAVSTHTGRVMVTAAGSFVSLSETTDNDGHGTTKYRTGENLLSVAEHAMLLNERMSSRMSINRLKHMPTMGVDNAQS